MHITTSLSSTASRLLAAAETASAQLAQAVGLGVTQQGAGVGVVQAYLERIGALDHRVGLDPKYAIVEQAPAHHRQHTAPAYDLAPGQAVGFTPAVMPLHGLDGFQHRIHGYRGENVFIS